ncbi:hypothetical protein MTX78_19785 [Hymenobacter tibetensis]|uniref:PglZ domain-containing protein n=1 Tax=Hymenobacter tibetensis TaxID=497967 RepID=A0ABY4CVP8_9BACT|nr:hypothetical protein [Hymenobacter tibetensis]UOG74346.1 hypothetical protein MTX78_19785 [Hymenobacter tibetensis]
MLPALSSFLLLDPHGDARVPVGYAVVATELEWLRETTSIGLSAPPIVVRGLELTRWVRKWWEARGGECQELVSPGYTLQRLVATLPTATAQAIAEELHTHWGADTWPAPLTLPAVLTALYPAAQALWKSDSNNEPAAVAAIAGQWLAWLHHTDQVEWPSQHVALLTAWLAEWEKAAPQAALLMPLDPAMALTTYQAWVGLAPAPLARPLRQAFAWAGPCPAPVPAPWSAAARQYWETDLPRYVDARPTGTEASLAVAAWWAQTNNQLLHPDLLPLVLNVAVQYVSQHRAALTADLLRTLRASMAPEDYARLVRYLPPPEPGPLPDEPEAVLRWTTDEYLPYRLWQATLDQPDEAAIATVRHHALAFGAWLLTTYPARLVGATHPYQHLYWAQPNRVLPQSPNEVVVWVIADGLSWADARFVAQKTGELSANRLSTTEAARCFGLLPTITHFTKVPVRAGIPYQNTLGRLPELASAATADVRDSQDPVQRASQLAGGQLLVWKPLQPDAAYHESAEASVVRRNALGILTTLAQTIVDVAQEIPRSLALRVLLTTDHGRMAGLGTRAVTVPEGFEAHGRVAYRLVPGPPPAPSPDIEWLDPEFFSLPGWAGVVRDERSFRKLRKDGSQAGGPDNFSHGGIWPEEVVVPWLTIQRDAVPIKITGSATGRARAGSTGTITLQLFNEADRPVRLRRLQISWTGTPPFEAEVSTTLSGQQSTSVSVPLSNWPDGLRIGTATLFITVELADGREQQFSLTNQLSTDEFQTRQVDLLGDL